MRKRFNYLLPIAFIAFSLCRIENAIGINYILVKFPFIVDEGNPMPVSGCDTVFPGPPSIRSASVTNTDTKKGEIVINFNTVPDKYLKGYVVFRSINNGTFNEIDTLLYTGKGIYQYFDNGLNTLNNTFSYYFKSLDSCGNLSAPSDTHSVVHLLITPHNQVNVLSWNFYKGFSATEYMIYKSSGFGAWTRIATVNGTTNTYNDSNVVCKTLYNYQILAVNIISNADSAFSDIDTGTAFKTTPPPAPLIINATVDVTSNNLGQIQLNWNASTSPDVIKYIIYRRQDNTSWLPVMTVPGNEYTYTDMNLNTHSSVYYYKILAIDNCGNTSIDNDLYHRTVNLSAVPGNEIINLNWNTYWGFAANKYALYKNGKFLKSFDSTVTSYTDSAINCPNSYNYVIYAIGVDTSAISNRDSAAPTDTTSPLPPVIKSASIKIPNSIVSISWLPSISIDAMGYKIYSTGNEGKTRMIFQNNSPDSIYDDTIAQGISQGCYYLIAYDHCGNSSGPSNPGCIINITGTVSNSENNLNWNRYELWQDSVSYYNIYREVDEGGWISIAQVPGSEIQFSDNDLSAYGKSFCYRVEAVETTGKYNATSWSTEICLSQPPIVYFPTAFTPNYSFNLNDYFGPKGSYFSTYTMKIFDRWGEMVYETETGQPWNGTYKGGQALSGLYQYQIEIQGFDGNMYQFKGTLDIVN